MVFVSDLVQLVSLLYVYSPSVSLVLCEVSVLLFKYGFQLLFTPLRDVQCLGEML